MSIDGSDIAADGVAFVILGDKHHQPPVNNHVLTVADQSVAVSDAE